MTEVEHLTSTEGIQTSAPIPARGEGEPRMWHFDIDARVNAGRAPARIDTPKGDQQYEPVTLEWPRTHADDVWPCPPPIGEKRQEVPAAVSQHTVDEKAGGTTARKAQMAMQDCRSVSRLSTASALWHLEASR